MPRGMARRRRQAEPATPVTYEISSDIETTMARITRLFPEQFRWTMNFKLGGVMVHGSKPKDEGGCAVLARFVKVPPLWNGLTGYDAIVRVEGWAWGRLGPTQQEALIVHELSHGAMTEKGTLRVMKHDLEEFGFVVRNYGAWQEGIKVFDKQLELFEPGLGRQEPAEAIVLPFTKLKAVAAVPPVNAVAGPETCPYPECVREPEHKGKHADANGQALPG